ncbi:MAG: chromosomal replication initiator protein DnaA [Thermodesulfobacteriota bacterium]
MGAELSSELAWISTRGYLNEGLSEGNIKIWIDPLQPLRLEKQTLHLGCPNRFFLAWVRDNYFQHLKTALERGRRDGLPVEAIELEVAPPVKPAPAERETLPRQQELPRLHAYKTAPLRFNPRYTFDRFVVGANNQYAYSATQALAAGSGLNTDSLYLLSEPGLGKSHLSQALSHQILTQDGRHRVYYLTAEDFTNELVHSIKTNCVEDFKAKYRRSCDVLVLEEIHFLSGKEKVQTELCYTLDCLTENNKRIVFTSSKLPRDIPRLGRQFASRLSRSLISTIEPPDYETRMKILERKARDNGLNVPEAVLDFMARRLTRDVRQMESSLNSLGAKSRLLDRSIDLALAQEILGDLMDNKPVPTLTSIQEQVCRYYLVTFDDLVSHSRRKNLGLPRKVGLYLSRKLTDLSLEAIGQAFGRNHSTVLYAVNLIENRCRRDHKLQAQIEFLAQQLDHVRPSIMDQTDL